jgi:hypothetical protein
LASRQQSLTPRLQVASRSWDPRRERRGREGCPSAILSSVGVGLSFVPQFRSHDVGPQAVVQPEAVRCVGIDPHAEDDAALRSCDHRGVGERRRDPTRRVGAALPEADSRRSGSRRTSLTRPKRAPRP